MDRETDIVRKLRDLCNMGYCIAFKSDWGDNTLTVMVTSPNGDRGHTHVGVVEGSEEALLKQLEDLLAGIPNPPLS